MRVAALLGTKGAPTKLTPIDLATAHRVIRGAWPDSRMQSGPVGELYDVAVERSTLEQLQVEVGRTLEDRS